MGTEKWRKVKLGDKCFRCGAELNNYNAKYINKGAGVYLNKRCKNCFRIYSNSVPSRTYTARAKQYVQWRYGLSDGEYQRKLELQLGGCAICKKQCDVRNRLSVDHDHKTGVVRDLLCHRCNMVLGWLQEDENLFINMIEYLKRHSRKAA